MSLLSGARNRRDIHLARQTAQRIKELNFSVNEYYLAASTLLTNTLASSGEIEDASQVRLEMNQSGLKKRAGVSWTEINDEIVV